MASVQPAPLLPGYTGFQVRGGMGDYPKNQTLKFQKGYATTDGESLPMSGHEQHFGGSEIHVEGGRFEDTRPGKPLVNTFKAAARAPQWVELDRKVLRWFGYYKEAVPESRIENYRIRKVIVHFYLDNDTLDVVEPKEPNSGLPQGVIIKRHKILKEDRRSPFTVTDFVVGETATLYGKTVLIIDADPYTRRHLEEKLGISMAPALGYPDDPFSKTMARKALHGHPSRTQAVAAATSSPTAHTLTSAMGKLETYLQNSGKVLRFYCVWDDRRSLYGDRRPYRLHYFLEDQTVEVLETNEKNSGRDSFPVFLRRGALPKVQDAASTRMGRNMPRNLSYGPSDFRVGGVVPIYGRDLFIHDCDSFTQEWYKTNMGFTDEEMAPVDVREPQKPQPVHTLPPPNGYGSLDDTDLNCTALVPRPPKRDFYKLMHKDKIVLRFRCRLVPAGAKPLLEVDRKRSMVLSYFAANDTISIFEPPVPNTGVIGGKYLERLRVLKPKSTEPYTDKDLYVGAVLDVHTAWFELVEADEFTLQYMESNRHEYPQADVSNAVSTIRDGIADNPEKLRVALAEADVDNTGNLTVDQLDAALAAANIPVIKHLVIALFRALQLPSDEGKSLSILDLERLFALRQ